MDALEQIHQTAAGIDKRFSAAILFVSYEEMKEILPSAEIGAAVLPYPTSAFLVEDFRKDNGSKLQLIALRHLWRLKTVEITRG